MDKRKLIAALALGGAIAIGSLFGGSDEPVSGSYRGGYYGGAGSVSGTVPATWDTLVYLFTMDATPNSYFKDHNDLVASADFVYELGTGKDIEEFAWARIDSAAPDGIIGSGVTARFHQLDAMKKTTSGEGISALDVSWPVGANRSGHLMYIPFEDFIPANSHVIYARMRVYNYSAAPFTVGDTIAAVLMTNEADNLWYTSKGVGSVPNYAHASWRNQISTKGGDPNWAADYDGEWDQLDRPYYWDWGNWFDWSGAQQDSTPSNLAVGKGFDVTLTNSVQGSVLPDAINNGIFIMGMESNNADGQWSYFGWDEDASSENKSPYIMVKVITKPYTTAWPGGKRWAFQFCTDDFQAANLAYTDTFLEHGGRYTIYGALIQIGAPDLTESDLINSHDLGMEIASHSKKHVEDPDADGPLHGGLASYAPAGTTGAIWDSLLIDISPDWMYDIATANDRSDLITSPLWAKSLGSPVASFSPYSLIAAHKVGYESYRALDEVGPWVAPNHYDYIDVAAWREADTDTARAGPSPRLRRDPRNMMMTANTVNHKFIVGQKGNTTVDPDSLKFNMKRAVNQALAEQRNIVSFLTHDFKTNPTNPDYTGGIDGDEIGLVCDVVDELDGFYTTAVISARWFKLWATPVPTPAGYSQADTFRFVAADRVWFVPDGIDTTFIPGFK